MSDIARKSVETLGFKIVSQAANMVAGIMLARLLGPYGKGTFAYVGSVLSMLLAINSGQSAAVSWQYGRLKRPSADVFAAMLRVLLYAGIPLMVILVGIALLVRGQEHLIAVAVALPFAYFSQMALGFYLADGKVRVFNGQILITSAGFLCAATLSLFVFHLGLNGVLVSWVISWIAAFAYTTLMLRPYVGKAHADASAHFREQAGFGLKASANTLVAFLNYQIDIFIIRFVLGPQSLGVYSIAIGAGELMLQLSTPLRQSAFRVINSGSRAESAAMTAKCVRHALAIIAIGCIALFIAAPYLVPLVYGSAFAPAATVIRFLIPGIIAYSVMPFFAAFFTQQLGRPSLTLRVLSLSTVVCAAVTLATIKFWGITAGAIGTSISYFTAFMVSVALFQRETGMPLRVLFGYSREDVQPYRGLLNSLWERARGLARGRRNVD